MNGVEVAATSILEAELRDRLAHLEVHFELQTTICFGDLIWDADFTLAELLAPDMAVILDSRMDLRRIVLQRVRGEIRYWLTMDRTPGAHSADCELGKVGSLDDAVALCNEFLSGAPDVSSLTTRRIRRRWGRTRYTEGLIHTAFERAVSDPERYERQRCKRSADSHEGLRVAATRGTGPRRRCTT